MARAPDGKAIQNPSKKGTEPAFSGALLNEKREGIYIAQGVVSHYTMQ